MATALGLRTAVGTGEESVYGTPVAIDRRMEIVSESLQRQNTILQSAGISGRPVTMRRGARRVISARMGSGDLVMELATNGMGRFFEHMLGSTPGAPTQQEATTAFLQTHEFGSLTGKALTVQKSLRDGAGTEIEVFTFHGCKVGSWEITCTVDAIPQLTLTLDAEDVDTSTASTALLALDEPTGGVFTFLGGALTVAGSPVARVLEATISGDNALKTDSFFIGSGGLKAEPEVTDFRSVTGSLRAEFTDPALFYDRFTADTGVALELTFTGENIETTYDEEIVITVPQVHFTGETPTVGGPELVENPAPFEASYDDTNPPITITYMSTDEDV